MAPSVVTLLGSEALSMTMQKVSSSSNILSSIIGIVNVIAVIPAGNATLYGPDL